MKRWALVLATAASAACTNDFDDFRFDGAGGMAAGGNASGGASAGAGGSSGDAGGAAGGSAGSGGSVAGAGTVVCEGQTPCALSSSMCCYRFSGPSCQSNAADCIGGADITCDGPEDCTSGQVCCARFGGGGFLIEMQCSSAGDCDGGGRRVVCSDDQPNCPDQTQCQSLSQLPYRVCR
jgi:hypothetical protein